VPIQWLAELAVMLDEGIPLIAKCDVFGLGEFLVQASALFARLIAFLRSASATETSHVTPASRLSL